MKCIRLDSLVAKYSSFDDFIFHRVQFDWNSTHLYEFCDIPFGNVSCKIFLTADVLRRATKMYSKIDEFHVTIHVYFVWRTETYFKFRWISELDSLNVTNGQPFSSRFVRCCTIADVLHFDFNSTTASVSVMFGVNKRLAFSSHREYYRHFFVVCLFEMRVGHSLITHVTCVAFVNSVGL